MEKIVIIISVFILRVANNLNAQFTQVELFSGFDKIDFSNFKCTITVLFLVCSINSAAQEKETDNFVNLLIFQTKPSNNLIFANKSEMELNKNKLNMKLFNGYKMEIKENSFETLLYDKYNFSINLDNNEVYNDSDTNTYGLLRLLKESNEINYLIINQRIVDSFLLITII